MSPDPDPRLQEFSFELPNYLLLEVFEYLPGQDLVVASHTCRLWHQLIVARRRLRTHAFVPSSHKPSVSPAETELHPVLSQLHFDTTVEAAAAEYGVHKAPRRIMAAAVSEQLATSPAVPALRLDVMKYHPHVVVENPDGVRVADVVVQLAKYKSAATSFTFEEFFGRELCSRRGYERKKRMRRVDMVGDEKVLVTFAPGVAFDGMVLFEAVRFRKRAAAADVEPKQRSVDAPSPPPSRPSSSSSSSSSSPSSPSPSSCSSSFSPPNPPRSVDPARDDSPCSRKSEGFRFWSAFAFQTSSSSLL